MSGYFHNLLVACDQFLNALLGGWPDETLSSRCWRWHKDGVRSWPCRLIDILWNSWACSKNMRLLRTYIVRWSIRWPPCFGRACNNR